MECCGLIVRRSLDGVEEYRPCHNIATVEDTFTVNPEDWADAEDSGTILALCHSHPHGNAQPSEADKAGCEALGLPSMIMGRDGDLYRLDPVKHQLNLLERPFSFGWNDCYSLVRDYLGSDLPDFPRIMADAERLFLEQFESLGFRVVSDLQTGDVILMKIRAKGPNHAAIYLGEGQILHHLVDRLSGHELYSGPYQQATTHILRRSA
jgi:proteasome lid subunit RPN8/RPN11